MRKIYSNENDCGRVFVKDVGPCVNFSSIECGERDLVVFSRDEAIAAARAILRHFNAGMDE